jgi:hypothetical protein
VLASVPAVVMLQHESPKTHSSLVERIHAAVQQNHGVGPCVILVAAGTLCLECTRAAKECRDRRRAGHLVLCGMTVFLVWTEATRLFDLRKVIAALTAKDTLHVKLLDDGTWVDFLQLLEDTGPVWGRKLCRDPRHGA